MLAECLTAWRDGTDDDYAAIGAFRIAELMNILTGAFGRKG